MLSVLTLVAPLLLITHGLAFWVLLQQQDESQCGKSGSKNPYWGTLLLSREFTVCLASAKLPP